MQFLAIIGLLALAGCEWGTTGPGIDAAGSVSVCGAITCSPSEFCDYSTNTCGTGFQETVTCRSRALSCGSTGPVCGCDGQIHATGCDATSAGADLDANGNCPLEVDHFKCGFKQCSLIGEVCQRYGPVQGGLLNTTFSCVPAPSACSASPSCECLFANQTGLCISICHGTSATGFVVECDQGVR